MAFQIDAKSYMAYIRKVSKKIAQNGEYISALDAATGDGDHWFNMNMGFEKLVAQSKNIEMLALKDCFKQIGILLMSTIGGSAGALYGSAYLAASKACDQIDTLDRNSLYTCLEVMEQAMMMRGQSKPGDKTMIDTLHAVVEAYHACMDKEEDDSALLRTVKNAAIEGAESTRNMPAVRGRAYYQADKGVGHLDPGAVTMSYQICCLCDHILSSIEEN